jgi:DNA-binding CsgD family transcriptional regulator
MAEELRVTQNTVRTHIKRIFEKTGTNRQAELVRVILLTPVASRSRAKSAKHH